MELNGRTIEELDAMIESAPSAPLYMERGRLHNRAGARDLALNDFMKALELDPGHHEARSHIDMLREIFAFRHMDYYNP